MTLMCKGKLLSAELRGFKPEGRDEEIKFWWAKISDPDADYPYGIKINKELGDSIFGNEGTAKQYLNQECLFTVKTSSFGGQVKYQITDVQTPKS